MISGETTFMTIGKPVLLASSTASSSLLERLVSATGKPYAAKTFLASISVRELRPSARALEMISRAILELLGPQLSISPVFIRRILLYSRRAAMLFIAWSGVG